ncbi:MAG: alkaline phosphatase [Chitinophagaceae bacterium]|nr:alkaline phosphatase [Chitinophagaceae bacterium]MCW5928888.1 alkaline phosphatase [Chitinophagaceae bacterium]
MKRRTFFRNASLTMLGSSLLGSLNSIAGNNAKSNHFDAKKAKNIIFMVSDGMSTGTLNMADMLLRRKEGRASTWISLYEQQAVQRALMDTASANALVTDSAAASSAWGGGVRVPNGSLNVGTGGEQYKPVLQKFKEAGKAVGCVTSVPIGHATPAGFCINNNKRGNLDDISSQYLPLRFDVMLGGGKDNFSGSLRKDKTDLFGQFADKGYTVLQNKKELLSAPSGAPVIGAFCESALPYELDRKQDSRIQSDIPTLAEMTTAAIRLLSKNTNGFVLQVEGGKVDWAAHANDIGALLYDQIAFDEALKVVIDFAATDNNTLVIITTDHGNANPGLFSGNNEGFDLIRQFRRTNDWILNGIDKNFTVAAVKERIADAQHIHISDEEAGSILKHYSNLGEDGLYNPRKLPFKELAVIQGRYTGIGWGSMSHSADYVELALFGPGSSLIKPFVKNTDLHYLMLQAAEITHKN